MIKKNKSQQCPDGFKLLITANDTIEANIIESKLKAAGIDTVKKYHEPGAYLTLVLGKTIMGVDIIVPEDKLDEAKAILESAHDVSDEDILTDASFDDEAIKSKNEESLKKLSIYTWIMMAILLVIFALIIVLYFK